MISLQVFDTAAIVRGVSQSSLPQYSNMMDIISKGTRLIGAIQAHIFSRSTCNLSTCNLEPGNERGNASSSIWRVFISSFASSSSFSVGSALISVVAHIRSGARGVTRVVKSSECPCTSCDANQMVHVRNTIVARHSPGLNRNSLLPTTENVNEYH